VSSQISICNFLWQLFSNTSQEMHCPGENILFSSKLLKTGVFKLFEFESQYTSGWHINFFFSVLGLDHKSQFKFFPEWRFKVLTIGFLPTFLDFFIEWW